MDAERTESTTRPEEPAVSRVEQWENRTEWWLAAAALLFLGAYALPIIDPGIPPWLGNACTVVAALVWVLFAGDLAMRLYLAENRRRYLREHLFDVAIIVLPLLRPLQLLRLVTLLTILNRAGSHQLRGRVVTYLAGGTILLVLCGGLAMTDAERGHPDASIQSVADGLWWAVVTMTTVGYGDMYPVTTMGRYIALALMLGGIALLGVVTATFASWLVEKVSEANEEEEVATRRQVEQLRAEMRALREELQRSSGQPGR
ncbi:potassium channel family protein [Georgenia alba]|uniref:Potassium channel family protein n=1 Tax=Georgenia alba TaxID=2233858 RepID=A0ABW2Q3Q6_9MICO